MLQLCRRVGGDRHPYRQKLMGQSLALRLENDMGNFRERHRVSGRLFQEHQPDEQGGLQSQVLPRRDDFQTSVDAHRDVLDDLREGAGWRRRPWR